MVERKPHDDTHDRYFFGRQQQSGKQLDRPKKRVPSNDRSFLGSSFAGQVGTRNEAAEAAE